jgi:hypothetical protein
MTRRVQQRGSTRLSRCGRGCRRPDVDEMIHAFPEKLSGSVLRIPKERKRRTSAA